MGKHQPSAPQAPDPTVVANAQANANQQTAQFQQQLNMVNSYGPYGNVTYQSDPSAPGHYSQTTTLSPGEQQLYNSGMNAQNGALNIANTQLGRIDQTLNTPLNTPDLQTSLWGPGGTATNNAVTNAIYGQAKSRLDPEWDMRQQQFDTKLANQGLGVNSTAYGTAQGQFGRDRNDAYNSALTSAIQQGIGASAQEGTFANQAAQQGFQNAAYNQSLPINEFSALLGLGQVNTPNGIQYSPTGVGQTDVLGAYSLNQAAQNARYQAQMQNYSSQMGGLYNLGAAAIMASDVRVKRDIRFLGRVRGLAVFAFKYLWSPVEHVGVMAQDVLAKRPDAVLRDGSGMLLVNYGAL